MHPNPSNDKQPWLLFSNVLNDFLKRFAVKQSGLNIFALLLCDIARDIQMRLVNFRKSAVDDFLVKFFLLLNPKHLPSLFIQNTGNTVKRRIMKIGIEC